jgi:Na+-transporting NADH:ubiquinone oxidoreductase subunit C
MRHSTLYTLVFATIVCLICAVLVSGSAVALRARQQQNALLDKQRNVLLVAGLMNHGEKLSAAEVEKQFTESIHVRLVELTTGAFPAEENNLLQGYDLAKVLADPAQSAAARPNPAKVLRLPKYGMVYEVVKNGETERVVLPVSGKGLWSTLYGLLAIDADGKTIKGITFYQHGETPGLGGEIENPAWQALWDGRVAYDETGRPIIQVVKGPAQGPSEVDGLSGATLTSRGVTNLVRFWLGENGYGPFLANLRKQR